MLKKFSCLVALTTIISLPAVAASNGLYVGGQISNTKLKISANGNSESETFNVLSGLAGYQFTPHFALEARYGAGVSDKTYREDGFSETISVSHQAALLAKGIVPVNDIFSLYGVAGFGSVKYKFKESGGGVSFSDSETIDGFTAGVGAAFNINPQWAVTVEYLQLPEEKYSEGPFNIKIKTSSLSVGVNYAF